MFLIPYFKFLQVCGVKPPYSKGGKSYPTCGLSCAETLKASGGMQHANAPAGQRGSSRSMCVVSLKNTFSISTNPNVSTLYSKDLWPASTLQQWKERVSDMRHDLRRKACPQRCTPEHVRGEPSTAIVLFFSSDRFPMEFSTATRGRDTRTIRIAVRHAERKPRWLVSSADAIRRTGSITSVGKAVRTLRRRIRLYLWKRDRVMSLLTWVSVPAAKKTICFFGKQLTTLVVTTVVNKFQSAWRAGGTCPVVKKVYKVVESKTFLQPYDAYR
jgi:hypothetical protein